MINCPEKLFCTHVHMKQNLDQNVHASKNMYIKQNLDWNVHVSISKKDISYSNINV